MTLVTVYHISPTAHIPAQVHKFLAKLTFNHLPSKKNLPSATTDAAAVEKVLLHDSDIIHCEDLTAQEFAKMAGIKIQSPEEEEEEEGDLINNEQQPMMSQMTSFSTRTALSTKSCHHIWDSDFWQCNDNDSYNSHKQERVATTNTSKETLNRTPTTTSTSSTYTYTDTLFISRLRSNATTTSTCSNTSTCNVIQKGRFKIVVGQDHDDLLQSNNSSEPAVITTHHVVLEWKRKRSDSSSTNKQ